MAKGTATDGLWLMIVGLALASWASGITACSNNRGPELVNLKEALARKPHSSANGNLTANAASFAGNWLCIDSGCPKDTIKTISPSLSSVDTTLTERLTPANSRSICRFQQTEQLTVTAEPDALTAKGTLVHGPVKLMPALENTHDCEDVLAKLNEIKPDPTPLTLEHDPDNNEILVNGVRYRLLAADELKAINASHYELNSDYASIAGQWVCIDDDCGDLTQTISPDLKTLTSDSVIQLPGDNQECHVSETSSLSVQDNSDPNKIYLLRSYGQIKTSGASGDMSDCADVAKNFNDDRSQNHDESEQIIVERDGNQEIVLLGKRYARKG